MTHRIYQEWFEVWEVDSGVFVIQEPLHAENVKSYLVTGTQRAVVIDTGMGVGDFSAVVRDLTSLPVMVVNSHAHWDHVGANWQFDEIAIHRLEAGALASGRPNGDIRSKFGPGMLLGPLPAGTSIETVAVKPSAVTSLLEGGEWIGLGGRQLEVIHAPGHSPGGIVLVDRDARIMFSTDVVYAGAIYAQFGDSSLQDYVTSLKRLEAISVGMRALYPSHGATPVDPKIVPKMREAMEFVRDGRFPQSVSDGVEIHQFDGFSILAPADMMPGASVS